MEGRPEEGRNGRRNDVSTEGRQNRRMGGRKEKRKKEQKGTE